MRNQIGFDFFLFDAPRVDVFSRLNSIDRGKRLALVFQRRGNWTLVEPVQRKQILS
jgi:hypothetical protein